MPTSVSDPPPATGLFSDSESAPPGPPQPDTASVWYSAPITVAAAALARAAFDPWIGPGPPFVFFVLAVLASAWFRGRRAGLLATALSVLAGWFLFVRPQYVWLKDNADMAARTAVFAVLGVVVTVISDRIRRAQALALAAEARFRRTFENASVGVAHVGKDGRWLWVNRRLCAITGYRAEQLIRCSFTDLAAGPGARREDFLTAAEAGVPLEREWRRADGESVWVNISVALQRDASGRPELLIAVVEDITARRRAEDAVRVNLMQLQATFDGMVEPALLVGSDSDIMAVNAAFLSLFDMTAVPKSREDLLRSFTLRLPDGSPVPNHRTPYGRALRGETVRDYELTARKERTGQVLHLLTGAAAVHDGDGAVRAVVVTFHDITERKRSEQKLARSNEVLRQFAYAAAHDLQEPLRNVGLSSEMLMRKFGQQFGDGGKQLLANNIDGARRMQRMVRDLLDYAMVIDVSTSVPPVCSADAVMRDVAGNLREAVAEAGADVQFEGLPAVRIERTHLLQLFQNLVGNSLKYRRHDVPPLIRVAAERRLGEVVFCVADNGIGFDPVHAQRIFGLFRRLHGQKDYPGTGIGLALCERIVEHYGGRIWAESMPGSGSRFYFALPDQRS